MAWYARKHGQLARIESSDRIGSVRLCLVGSRFREGVLAWCPVVLVSWYLLCPVCHFGNYADCTVARQAASVCFNFSYRQAAALCRPTTHHPLPVAIQPPHSTHISSSKSSFFLPSTWALSWFCFSPAPQWHTILIAQWQVLLFSGCNF